ncbi:MAG: zinc ribbon domain-containing protein [Promethearchaeota archaeon]
MDIHEFNRKLKGFIHDAKILEKTNPQKAQKLWLKIAEFALEFSKQPGIDRNFKLRLWNQINAIVKRVKEESGYSNYRQDILSANSPEHVDNKDAKISSESPQTPTFDQSSIFDPSNLPSVPTNDAESQGNENLDDEDYMEKFDPSQLPHLATANDTKKQAAEEFYKRIMKMEDELKQMPDYWKEINPEPYRPEKSIIPSQKSSTSDEKDQSKPIIKVEKAEKPLFDESPIKSSDDFVDPYRGTKDIDEKKIKDPFSAESIEFDDSEVQENIFCKLCGEKIPVGSNKCPKCGAEL